MTKDPDQGICCETQPRARRRRGDGESVAVGSRIVKSVKDAIVIDESENEVVDHIYAASKDIPDMKDDSAGATQKASGLIQVRDFTLSEEDPRDEG